MDKRPVIFGEVLFDVFAPDTQVLGGAPFNVAWHLQGFGVQPLFVSAVGADERGRQIKASMLAWGMDLSGLQSDTGHPSGVVQVKLIDGQPSYVILPDQAYDFIQTPNLSGLELGLLYHGSLALRQPVSQRCLQSLQQNCPLPVFIDINLRPPWWQWQTLDALMQGATWLKLNDEELSVVIQSLGFAENEPHKMGRALRAQYGFETLILTQGEKGAMIIGADETIEQAAPPLLDLVDTVGAGDAFSSVCLLGFLKQWPLQQVLQRALQFAAQVCRQRGAIVMDQAMYQSLIAAWSD